MKPIALPPAFNLQAWIAPGDVLLGKYEYAQPLAEGRISAILKVHDGRGTEWAAKAIKPAIRLESSMEQFAILMGVMRREAEMQAHFRHKNIIRVQESGFDPILGVCTVMEYAPLGNLRQRIRAGALDLHSSLAIIAGVLDALACLHAPSPVFRHGVAHLDLEPKNVVFGKRDVPKICDFHYARPINTPPNPDDYIDEKHPIDTRTDLQQVGMLLYEMLSGEQPQAINLLLLPAPVRRFVAALTEPDPERRIQSAPAARKALDEMPC
jgi:serine/threonine protein kinase